MVQRRAEVAVVLLTAAIVLVTAGQAGAIDLGPEEIVDANGVDIIVPGYSVPSFEDWNNDLLKDLIVGEGSPSFGRVRIYLNVGTEADPQFDSFF